MTAEHYRQICERLLRMEAELRSIGHALEAAGHAGAGKAAASAASAVHIVTITVGGLQRDTGPDCPLVGDWI